MLDFGAGFGGASQAAQQVRCEFCWPVLNNQAQKDVSKVLQFRICHEIASPSVVVAPSAQLVHLEKARALTVLHLESSFAVN